MRRLNAWVHAHRDDGTSQVFGPGSVPPEWAARQITNPKAWEGDDEDTVEIPQPPPPPPRPGQSPVVRPPRRGVGATRQAWATYASALGVLPRGQASRDEIIAAVDTK